MRIAIDVMGGDFAPEEIVRGAADAAKEFTDANLILVGQEDKIREVLGAEGSLPNVEIKNATQTIAMDEEPVTALRRKVDSSLRVALRLVKHGQADAIISAGNTGALVGGAQLGIGLLEGVKRPGIAIPIPTRNGFAAIIDVGANPNCRAIHLLQYGVMGSFYVKYLKQDVSEPVVALLNIGEESTKGTAIIQEAFAQFKRSTLNFMGNVEPHQIFQGKVDVVVCDGFTGNLMLKMAEGFGGFIQAQLANGLSGNVEFQRGVEKIFEKIDYNHHGGAPVLGVRGIVIKCHGRSKATAVKTAVGMTCRFIKRRLNDHIVEEIRKMSFWGRLSEWWTPKKDNPELP